VPPTVGVSSATGDHAVAWRLKQGKAALTAGSTIYAQEPLSDRAATGSIRLESLFLTLPTRALTGQQIMSSAG
jgi:hypothetical protein